MSSNHSPAAAAAAAAPVAIPVHSPAHPQQQLAPGQSAHHSLSMSFASPPPNLPTGASFASRGSSGPAAVAPTSASVASGASPSSSSVLSSNSPITPSPILASALSLPSGAGFNPFFSTSPSSGFSPATAGHSYGRHTRSFSITGGSKPIVISGFPGVEQAGSSTSTGGATASSAVDDDEDSPPPSAGLHFASLRRPSQPLKLPAQLQNSIKPPSASSTGQAVAGGKAPAGGGTTADGAGRGHGVLRRLSLGANSLLARPNLNPQPATPAPPAPSTTMATAGASPSKELGVGPTPTRARTTVRKGSAAGGSKKRGISPTGERILQGHF